VKDLSQRDTSLYMKRKYHKIEFSDEFPIKDWQEGDLMVE
jgi:hypothetical protein